jgi:hypothetical protein
VKAIGNDINTVIEFKKCAKIIFLKKVLSAVKHTRTHEAHTFQTDITQLEPRTA